MDSDREPPQAFLTALVTEHFVLQGSRSTLTSESASRAALYLASLTGSLIALGFVSRDAAILGPFAAAVMPALVILGEFTYWRLVQSGVEDLHHAWEMRRIRAYYRHLVPPGLAFFADTAGPGPTASQRRFLGVTARDLNVLLTASSMVGAINSMVAAAGVALAAHATVGMSPGAAISLAVVLAIVLYLAHARLAIHLYNLGLADLRVSAQVS